MQPCRDRDALDPLLFFTVKIWRRSTAVSSPRFVSNRGDQKQRAAGAGGGRNIRRAGTIGRSAVVQSGACPIPSVRLDAVTLRTFFLFQLCIWRSLQLRVLHREAFHCTVKMKLIDSSHAHALAFSHTHCFQLPLVVLLASSLFFCDIMWERKRHMILVTLSVMDGMF